jgi:hypothetical protein
MTRARGQPSRTLLDREYPHQVLVLADTVRGKTLDTVTDFHVRLGIPTKSRSIRKDDAWYSLYCFADREHAKLFQVMFGGQSFRRRIQSSINPSSIASNGATIEGCH